MKRSNHFLVVAICIVIGAAFVVAAAGPVQAAKYNWKLASVLPESHPVHKALVMFADKVKEKTNGEAVITVYPAGQLGQEKDYIEGVQLGSIEFTKVSSAPLGQFSKTLQVGSLPFIWKNLEHQHAVLEGPIGAKLMADLENNRFKGLAFFDAGFRNVTTRVGPVRKPDDLKGLKIRVMKSKPLIATINAFGATAIPMGQSEVYVALQQKVIDGWENNEPTVIAFNMQEVAKYYSYTRHVSIPDILIMSKQVFDSASTEIQKAILEAAKEAIPVQRKIWADFVGTAKSQLKAKGMEFNEVDDITEFQAKAKPLYEEYEPIVGADLIQGIMAAAK
ncbi:MAG: TRAP transporter substrate-binding protein [Deltaproteobacteria bacterium]|nr:MAG: TRAP transporter substrate-binding protein [Deltaproteobacteria bacterium]